MSKTVSVCSFLFWVLLNRGPSSSQLHPSPRSSFEPPLSSTHVHPAHFSLRPALCNTLNNIWTKILYVIGQFPQKNFPRKIKSCPFWLKIGPHDILEVLIPKLDLHFWNSDPKIHFWANLDPKIQNCPFCLKIGSHSILRMLIPNPDLNFWNSDPKIHFWVNLGWKSQSCLFCLKIGTHAHTHTVSRRCWFLFRY